VAPGVRITADANLILSAPLPIATGAAWRADPVDAVVVWKTGRAYFFYGPRYVRYDVVSDRVDVGSFPIGANWPGCRAARRCSRRDRAAACHSDIST
jgi:hypothetical protein